GRRGHGGPRSVDAVLERAVEDHGHRGDDEQRQVAERGKAQAVAGHRATSRAANELASRMASENPMSTTDTAPAPTTSPLSSWPNRNSEAISVLNGRLPEMSTTAP